MSGGGGGRATAGAAVSTALGSGDVGGISRYGEASGLRVEEERVAVAA